ncbi:class I SAM-dependent methyltransferase [Granulibacter bethesdensis]|uniref:class I SAM-dependent methyltransferase n=1 Tax=Granulibacter bethesdensis TaxID=364410 RepID=UPI0003F1D9F8|nr:class I SAM-dependent methyltransferase [Granulibacter bethesdensis]AHJ66729.1 Polyketide synthase O-methyltransferase [Granulibacter bethesdensis CGDNIH4]
MNAEIPRPIRPVLCGIPETTLWTLHDRAAEAARPDGILHDPHAIRMRNALMIDWIARFGAADGSFAGRSRAIDTLLTDWLSRHPDGMVISIGEGLETQSRRVDNGTCSWLSVDLPEVIALRRQMLPDTERFRSLGVDALDTGWLEAIDPSRPCLFLMQGLLMYFPPNRVAPLLRHMTKRFPASMLIFDTVPVWFATLTAHGLHKTPLFTVPRMRWGIDRDRIGPTLACWSLSRPLHLIPYGAVRGRSWMASLALSPQNRLISSQGRRFSRDRLPVIVTLPPA